MKRTAGWENELNKCLKLSCMSSSGQKIEKDIDTLLQGVHLYPGVTSCCSWKLKKGTYPMDSMPQIISNNCLTSVLTHSRDSCRLSTFYDKAVLKRQPISRLVSLFRISYLHRGHGYLHAWSSFYMLFSLWWKEEWPIYLFPACHALFIFIFWIQQMQTHAFLFWWYNWSIHMFELILVIEIVTVDGYIWIRYSF